MSTPTTQQVTWASQAKNFFIGGVSGMCATCIVQPVDMIKVRIQLKSEARGGSLSPITVAKEVYAEGGIKKFYRGLDSALTRQALYATSRLGIYFSLSDYLRNKVNDGKNLSAWQKIYSSLTAGAIGSMIGTPADLALIRMQSDTTLPVELRRNYRHVGDAFARIVREEGFFSCWKGCTPTVVRAMVLNLGMLSSYDESKERLEKVLGRERQTLIWFLASTISGAISAAMSLPFDNVKTKMQKMTRNSDGTYAYKSLMDCAIKTAANEGVLGFWAGLPTYVVRLAPHIMITLIASEYLKKLLK